MHGMVETRMGDIISLFFVFFLQMRSNLGKS